MIIFLRNIPNDTLRSDIAKFIFPAIKGGLFREKGEIKFIKLLAMRGMFVKTVEHHALVAIEPDKVALRVIKKLHSTHLKGKRIIVRQYSPRDKIRGYYTAHNDQRRELEITEIDSPQVIGDRKFHRIHTSKF